MTLQIFGFAKGEGWQLLAAIVGYDLETRQLFKFLIISTCKIVQPHTKSKNRPMKKLLFSCLLMLSVHLVFSQDLMPQVLASAGTYGETASGYSLSSTIGEQATETIAGDVSVLTQGFQQPQEVIIIIDNTKDLNIGASVQVFPNPTSDVLNVQSIK